MTLQKCTIHITVSDHLVWPACSSNRGFPEQILRVRLLPKYSISSINIVSLRGIETAALHVMSYFEIIWPNSHQETTVMHDIAFSY